MFKSFKNKFLAIIAVLVLVFSITAVGCNGEPKDVPEKEDDIGSNIKEEIKLM